MSGADRERLYRHAVGVGAVSSSDYCNGCERTIRLRKDGAFQRHTVRTLSILCPGSGLTPQQARERDLWGSR